ncbi:MAG: hypothetical protein ACI4HI_00855 [Lachnospiraceae bacterium]
MDKEKMAVVVKDLTVSFGMVFAVYLLFSKNLFGKVTNVDLGSDVLTAIFFYHIGAAEIWMMVFFVKKLSLLGFVLQILVVDRLVALLPAFSQNGLVQLVPASKWMLVCILIYWLVTWMKIKKDTK